MTPRINLLPHREARRELKKKVFWAATALSFIAGLVMIGLVWSILQGYISNQQGRNEFVRAENRKLDSQIKEIATLRRKSKGCVHASARWKTCRPIAICRCICSTNW